MTNDAHANLARWSEAIYNRQTLILKELSKMAADLTALQAAVAKIGTDVDSALAALAAAKANEADPAVVAQMTADLTATSGKIAAAVAPAA